MNNEFKPGDQVLFFKENMKGHIDSPLQLISGSIDKVITESDSDGDHVRYIIQDKAKAYSLQPGEVFATHDDLSYFIIGQATIRADKSLNNNPFINSKHRINDVIYTIDPEEMEVNEVIIKDVVIIGGPYDEDIAYDIAGDLVDEDDIFTSVQSALASIKVNYIKHRMGGVGSLKRISDPDGSFKNLMD